MNRTCLPLAMSCVVLIVCLLGPHSIGAAEALSVQAASPDSQALSVVGRIGDFTISKEDLTRRLLQELRPQEAEFYRPGEPVAAETVLRKMLAEKAASLEGRRLGYLDDEQIHTNVAQFEQQQLVRKLLETELNDKLVVEDSEIDRAMKDNPKATREQAKMVAQRTKALRLMDEYYGQVTERRKLRKMAENLPKATEIHQRLLTQPREPRGPGEYWIRNSQLSTDLSEEEKKLTLAVYEGGEFTLKDWFQMLCNIAPPRRPKDLDKPEGVGRLLDLALRAPVLAAEARSHRHDKDLKLRRDVKTLEDQRLQYKMQEEKTKHVKEPAAEQVKEHFEKDPGRFATNPVLKVDQIWCQDEEIARKVKGMLDEGADFQAVKSEHSLQKDIPLYSLSPGSEGLFWDDLWKGEPNQVLGPVMGFHGSGVKWRVVKVQEKTPAQTQAYSDQLASSVKWTLFGEQRQQALRDFEKELLEKYPHEIYHDRIEDLDPLEIALKQQDR